MPDRIVRYPWGWFRDYSEPVLLILLCVTLVFAIWGWQKAANAQTRVNTLEVERAARESAEKEARKTQEVATCFSTARTRPTLLRLLRNINSTEPNAQQRRKTGFLIDEFANAPVTGIEGIPTRAKCVELAKDLAVDFQRYDFDPATGRLLHPGKR